MNNHPTWNDPILFLDLDGVVNHHEWWKRRGERPGTMSETPWFDIDPASVGLLNQLLERSNAYVVISSTWRLHHDFIDLENILKRRGFYGRVIDCTPELPSRYRGDEIKEWLRTANGRKNRPNPSGICILDDDSDMGNLLPYLVKTSMDCGLTQKHVDDAVYMLSKTFNMDLIK